MTDLDKIDDLAQQIYALAATMPKASRHLISDAASLIRWVTWREEDPARADEAETHIHALRASLAPKEMK